MKWILARLLKGNSYPQNVFWPPDTEAYIPLEKGLLKQPAGNIDPAEVCLYWTECGSQTRNPLFWKNEQGCLESSFQNIYSWLEALKEETYRPEHKKSITAILPFHYHKIPGSWRNVALLLLKAIKARPSNWEQSFPVSYFNPGCEIVQGVSQLQEKNSLALPLLVLTHDIDSAAGLDWVLPLATIEEKLGYRSLWDIVPKYYQLDHRLLKRLLSSNHEIGIHGIWHNNQEAFLKPAILRQELDSLKNIIGTYSIQGYRSPSWYRTKSMFDVLAGFFKYDLSCIDIDLICPGGNGGTGMIRPFRKKSGLIELSCTLPFEAPLFSGIKPAGLVNYWQPKIDFIKNSKGLLLVNTHPDPHYSGNASMLAIYEELLTKLKDEGWKGKLPREIAGEIR